MDLKTAYQIMGLSEDCSMDELTKKYYELTDSTRIPPDELEAIQNAYNIIRDHIEATTPPPEIPFKEKVSDFLYHYRMHLIGGAIALILLGSLAYSIITTQIDRYRESKLDPPAIEIMFYGHYYFDADLEPIENRILDLFPEWSRIKTELVYAPSDVNTEMDIAALQRSAVMLATERPDIYIVDEHQLERMLEDAPLHPLDEFEEMAELEDKLILSQQEGDDRDRIYGIDLTESKLFADTEIEIEDKIAIVRSDSENIDNAVEFLLKAIEQ